MSGHFVKEFQDGREKRVTRVPGVPKLSGRGQSVKRLAIPNDSSQRQFGHVHWVAEFPDRDTFWNGDTCGTKALAQRLQEIQGGKTPKTKDPRPGFIKICAPAPACLARSLAPCSDFICSALCSQKDKRAALQKRRPPDPRWTHPPSAGSRRRRPGCRRKSPAAATVQKDKQNL